MKNYQALCLGAVATFMLASCSNDDNNLKNSTNVITFTSSINQMTSRAAGNNWEDGDKVGVYMVADGQGLAGAIAENAIYSAKADGTLTPLTSSSELEYPSNGSSVDFISYYPMQIDVTNGIYKVNVANQESLGVIDLMYATAANYNKSSQEKPNLLFEHKLSQIYFNIETEEAIASKSDIYVTLEGINTTADFNLDNGTFANVAAPATVYANISVDANGAHAAALVLPGAVSGVKVNVFYQGKKLTVDYPDATLASGIRYVHQMKIAKGASPLAVAFTPSGISSWNDQAGADLNIDINDGEDYEPTVETPTNVNLALGKSGVQVSSGVAYIDRINDGAYDKIWQQSYKGLSNISIDLEQVYDVDKFVNFWDPKAYPTENEYLVSVDGQNYTSVAKYTDWKDLSGTGIQTVILDAPVKARYVKCVFDKSSSDFLISTYEFEVYLQGE